MTAMTVQQPVSAATVPEQNQILTQYPNQQRQFTDLGGHRNRLPVPAHVFAASRAWSDMGKLAVFARDIALVISAIASG